MNIFRGASFSAIASILQNNRAKEAQDLSMNFALKPMKKASRNQATRPIIFLPNKLLLVAFATSVPTIVRAAITIDIA